MLARRELSEARIRERLVRRGHAPDAVDEAVARLRAERALDDARVAEAIARNEASERRRSRLRVRLEIERAGIAGGTAQRAVDDAFEAIHDDDLMQASIESGCAGARRLPTIESFSGCTGISPDRVSSPNRFSGRWRRESGCPDVVGPTSALRDDGSALHDERDVRQIANAGKRVAVDCYHVGRLSCFQGPGEVGRRSRARRPSLLRCAALPPASARSPRALRASAGSCVPASSSPISEPHIRSECDLDAGLPRPIQLRPLACHVVVD